MLIDRRQLEELVRHKNEENQVVSVYLNLTPPRSYASELNSMTHTILHSLADRLEADRLRRVEKVFEKIEKHVRNNLKRPPERTRLAAIFADPDGFWQEYFLPVALPSRTVVEPNPYTRPLTMLLDEFERYCVLVCDARKARIFSLYLGEFEEQPDIFVEHDVPGRVRVTGSRTAGGPVQAGMGDENIQRNIEDRIHRHLRDVALRTFDFFKGKDFDRVLLGGPEHKVRHWLKDHLHSYLKKRLAGEFNSAPDDSSEDLRRKALQTAQAYEREQEKALIDDILEKSGPGGMAVLGAEPVIEALSLGQVHTLVIDNDFRMEGYVCPGDHILSTYLETCPLCENPMEQTEDLGDEMVEEALRQGSEIEHVFADHEELKKHGVGALLRFSLT
ncbi:MAG: hypothetical protein ACLFUE_02385 [Desulfobacteraceae bacterium]